MCPFLEVNARCVVITRRESEVNDLFLFCFYVFISLNGLLLPLLMLLLFNFCCLVVSFLSYSRIITQK